MIKITNNSEFSEYCAKKKWDENATISEIEGWLMANGNYDVEGTFYNVCDYATVTRVSPGEYVISQNNMMSTCSLDNIPEGWDIVQSISEPMYEIKF